jgi:putative tryptophan/tyrosine transport system substrate-binding protein
MIARRRFIFATFFGAVGAASSVQAQQKAKVWRIGYLTPTAVPAAVTDALVAALGQLGYVAGKTLRLEVRAADDDLDRLPELAAAMAQSNVDVIVAVSPPAIRAASRATRTVPVVMAFWGGEGLIESGIVANFARPGTNVTGVYMLAAELDAKRLALLLEAMPSAKKVAVLNPGPNWSAFTEVRQVAQSARVELFMSEEPDLSGYEHVFDALAKERVDALLVPSFPRFFREHREIIEGAASRHIPAMYEWGDIARDGGLMAYGPVFAELNRVVAMYVDKILKGANPAGLPIEQPNKFEFVINLRTAKALGLSVPQSLLLRADEVIQ